MSRYDPSSLTGAVPLSHHFLATKLLPGDRAVDATCGAGNDTLLMARLVGAEGRVWGFDLQTGALELTRGLLEREGVADWVTLVAAGHERMGEFVEGPVKAVVFNLGYLPGGERGITTRSETTVPALEQTRSLLEPGGVVLICLYTGHPGGREEGDDVEAWAAALDPQSWNVWQSRQLNRSSLAPYVVLVERR